MQPHPPKSNNGPGDRTRTKERALTIRVALRLHPVIPTNAREAKRDTTLPVGGGSDGRNVLFVKKGTLIVYNVFAMHRDEAVFGANPEEFEPERWAGLRPGWGYLPFNGGPRICLGREYKDTQE